MGMTSPQSSLVRKALAVTPFLLALVLYGAWLSKVRPPLTGDEPCYVVQAKSLAHDQDLDLTNEFADPSGITTISPDVGGGRGCASEYRHDGKLRAYFNPGLSLLLAPIVGLTFQVTTMRIVMVVIAAILAHQLFGLLQDVSRGRRRLAVAVWLLVAFSLPLLGYSNQFYPEVPAALGVTICVRCLLRCRRGKAWGIGAALSVAYLPWLHYRFAVIAGVLTLFAWVTVTQLSRRSDILPSLRSGWYILVPFTVSIFGLALFYSQLYGSPMPSAPYRGGAAALQGLSWLQIYKVGIGSLIGSTPGLLPFNPFFWLAIAGTLAFGRRFGTAGWVLLALAGVQVFFVNPLGFFGYTLPGRFLVVLLPLLAVSSLVAIEAVPRLGVVAGVLAVATLVPVYEGVHNYGRLYDVGRPQTMYSRFEAIWPRTQNLLGDAAFGYRPERSERTIGSLGQLTDGRSIIVSALGDGRGVVAHGPEVELRSGAYLATIEVNGIGPPGVIAGRIRIEATRLGGIIAERTFRWDETMPPQGREITGVLVPFLAPEDGGLSVTVSVEGTGTLQVGAISAHPTAPLPRADGPVRRGMPLAALWLVLSGIAAYLLVVRSSAGSTTAAASQQDRPPSEP